MFLNDSMQAVVIMACEKHAPDVLKKLSEKADGNWFVLPPVALFRTGYWPHVSESHVDQGCAIFGFIERESLARRLQEFSEAHLDNGVCPNCAVYDWGIASLHTSQSSRDPVCGRLVPCNSSLSQHYDDRLYFFCSMGCRDRFHLHPQEFKSKKQEEEVVANNGKWQG